MAERREVTVEPQIIEGFKAYQADADFYTTVAKGTEEKFGKDSRAYKTIMNGINPQNGTGSQFFFNTEAGLYLAESQRVAKFDDLGRINNADPDFFKGIYTDTQELVLRTATFSWQDNAKILENLVAQARERELEFSPENPLVLSGLELVGDDDRDNPYEIIIQIGDKTVYKNDPRFAYGTNSIKSGYQSRKLFTRQDGLSGVFLGGSGCVGSDGGVLRGSGGCGRVIVFDADAVASENFDFEAINKKYLIKG